MLKIKIVHMVEDLKIGGLEKVIAAIVTGLDRKKYQVEVWCLASGGKIADVIKEKICLKILNLPGYYNPLNIIKLSYLLFKSNTDIVHTHGYFASTFGRIAAILARIPVIISHVHTMDYSMTGRNIAIERALSVFTHKIICISNAVKRFVIENEHIRNDKTCVIYNGIEIPYHISMMNNNNKKSITGFEDNSFVIISVASLTHHKGHQVLLDAVKKVSVKWPQIRVVIVGDGPVKKILENFVLRSGLSSKVLFAGEQENVFPFLNCSDLFVLASIDREGLGISIIEAMSLGKPVIASNLGGIPEVVQNGINGLLFTPGHSEELALAIEKMIETKQMIEVMGQAGKKIYKEKFTCNRMVAQIEKCYEEAIEKRSAI
jgi:glycosyltransferase involved in cell wall biosynthesis